MSTRSNNPIEHPRPMIVSTRSSTADAWRRSKGVGRSCWRIDLAIFLDQISRRCPELRGSRWSRAIFDFGKSGRLDSIGPTWPSCRRRVGRAIGTIPSEDAWTVVPDLAVEVVSPTNSADRGRGEDGRISLERRASGWSGWSTRSRRGSTSTTGSPTVRVVSGGRGCSKAATVLPGFQLPLDDRCSRPTPGLTLA